MIDLKKYIVNERNWIKTYGILFMLNKSITIDFDPVDSS